MKQLRATGEKPMQEKKKRRRFVGWLVVALVAIPAIALAAYFVSINVGVDYSIGTPPTLTAEVAPSAFLFEDPAESEVGPVQTALPSRVTCTFAVDVDGNLGITFNGFFPNERCGIQATLHSDEALTNLQAHGGDENIHVWLTDSSYDGHEAPPFDMASDGSGGYEWLGFIVIQANENTNVSGTISADGQIVIGGDFNG